MPSLRAACARLSVLVSLLAACTGRLPADPLSRSTDINFFGDVPSRSLHGLAVRSDGVVLPGPNVRDLDGVPPADLLWCLAPADSAGKAWYIGTGPEGRILRATVDTKGGTCQADVWALLPDQQVFALSVLSSGEVLAGTSPHGHLVLLREGKPVARADLPVDSVLDILPLQGGHALVATGNPGRIYRVDVAAFKKDASVPAQDASKTTASDAGAAPVGAKLPASVKLFGEVRDTNLRRLALLPDGRVVAGSAPRGNLYVFPAQGGAPRVLQENQDAEVADLLVQDDGTLYAALTFSTSQAAARVGSRPASTRSAPSPANASGSTPTDTGDDGAPSPSPGDATSSDADHSSSSATSAETPRAERFAGRGVLVQIAPDGFPEVVASRSGVAFYRMASHGGDLLLAAGEQGDLLGYDPAARRSLTYPGSTSSQLNDLAPLPGAKDRFLALRNNPAGLTLVDFAAPGARTLETRRLDLGAPARIGAVRFALPPHKPVPKVELRSSFGAEELEGWSDWEVADATDNSFSATPTLAGRYVRLRLTLPESLPDEWSLESPRIFDLPQDRRPQLGMFRFLSPNYALRPAPARAAGSPITTLGQVLGAGGDSDGGERVVRNSFMSSQVVPSPGTQIATWSLADPDGDTFKVTFSLRSANDSTWRDLAVDSSDSYVNIDLTTLDEGLWHSRLVVTETAPRPEADRLTVTYATDDLVVDRTPPEIQATSFERTGKSLRVRVTARDALSLLAGAEFSFNNGFDQVVEQPADGILDGQRETFDVEVPLDQAASATAVEVSVQDEAGNVVTRRIELK